MKYITVVVLFWWATIDRCSKHCTYRQ